MKFPKRSWVEIDTRALVDNCAVYREFLMPGQRLMAVVKADAYGHGDGVVAPALEAAGIGLFAVSNIMEAIKLREAGIKGEILILGYTPPEYAEELKAYDITQTLLDEETARVFADKGIKAQFAIDTGMNRIGLDADAPAQCERVIRAWSVRYELTGLFTHLCVADTPEEDAFTQEQIDRFRAVADRVQDLRLPFIHCMNSAGGMRVNRFGNVVRLGIVMYGLKPDRAMTLPEGIVPVLTWKSVVSMVKTVKKGETVGYGRTFTAPEDMRIATVPTGYADGYPRKLSNRADVLVHGRRARVTGRVCMDQMMIDVTDIPDVKTGDEVELMGRVITADELADKSDTIGYEIVCGISKRVPRLYPGMIE